MRAGIVGCGRVAGNHAAALQALEGVELVGVADTTPGRAATFAAAHGVPRAVTGVPALLELDLDLVTVATPHPTHAEVVVAAAGAGMHVLCEKPIALDLAEADRMIAACDAAGVRFGAVFQRRFWPAAQRIRDAIDDGTLGPPVLGHASLVLHREADYFATDPGRPTAGTGVLATQAVHHLDLLGWYLGECVEVSAATATLRPGLDVEDLAVATLRFASGALATLSATTAATPGLGTHLQVTGATGATAGLAEYPEGTEGRLDVWAVPGAPRLGSPFGEGARPDPPLSEINRALTPFHTAQVVEFVEAVREGRDPAVTGRDARRSLAVLTAIHAAATTGGPVALAREEHLV